MGTYLFVSTIDLLKHVSVFLLVGRRLVLPLFDLEDLLMIIVKAASVVDRFGATTMASFPLLYPTFPAPEAVAVAFSSLSGSQ